MTYPFVAPTEKPVGYTVKPSDYNQLLINLMNLNERLAALEASGFEGGLAEPTNVPIHGILIWTQSSGSIPTGWALCDGNNGTVDLRGRFVYGASVDSDLGVATGSETHTHSNSSTGSVGDHTHSGSGSTGIPSGTQTAYSGTSIGVASSSHTHSFSFTTSSAGGHSHSVPKTQAASSLPPCIKLYYIERIS